MNSANIRDLLAGAVQQLTSASDTPRLDAEILLAAALDRPRGYLFSWPERRPEPEQAARFAAWLQRRLTGEPVAYLLGRREFWSLELDVTPDTLIPRPDTELLVELALAHLPTDRRVTVADLGAGSGAIALALAVERPQAQIVATDCSAAALTVAGRNAQRLGIGNVEFRQGDWLQPLVGERFDLIASNPPYIATLDSHWQRGELRFEPSIALAAGADGLDALRLIIAQASAYLKPNGWLWLEHGDDQGEIASLLLWKSGFVAVSDYCDVAGLSRVSGGRWPD